MKISFKAETNRDVLLHLGIIVALLVLLVLGFFYAYLPYTTNHGQTVAVPDLRGMHISEVEKFLSERDLEYVIDDSTYDPRAKPLTVNTQDPAPNANVKQGRKIFLTINAKNPPMVKMPKLINRSLANAQSELEGAGLLLGTTSYVPDLQINMVLKQQLAGKDIVEGTPIPKGSRIDLVIGDGLGQQEFDVPNLVGMPFEEVQTTLAGNGLQLGTFVYQQGPDSLQNVVVKQKPTPGSKIRTGDMVDVWIIGTDPQKSAPAND